MALFLALLAALASNMSICDSFRLILGIVFILTHIRAENKLSTFNICLIYCIIQVTSKYGRRHNITTNAS